MIQHAWGTAGGTPFEYGLQTDWDCEEARLQVEHESMNIFHIQRI